MTVILKKLQAYVGGTNFNLMILRTIQLLPIAPKLQYSITPTCDLPTEPLMVTLPDGQGHQYRIQAS